MKVNNVNIKRWCVLKQFKGLGFSGFASFYNVCISIQPTLNRFDVLLFWEGINVSNSVCDRIAAVIEVLKNE
ncbi:hypothetical protein ACIVBQ_000447 [Tenacibaculum discolor]